MGVSTASNWTVAITSIVEDATTGIARVTYVYTAGAKTDTVIERVADVNSIKKIAIDHVNELNRKEAIDELIKSPTTGTLDLGPPVLTDEQIRQQRYITARQNLIDSKVDLDLGLIDQAAYNILRDRVIALKP